jgi:hypothetical protein
MSGMDRRALLSDAEIEEIAQKAIDVLNKGDADKEKDEGDKPSTSDNLEEIMFSSDKGRTAMSVQKLIVAAVATRSVFCRLAQLSDEEKEEVVKKVKEKMDIQDDEGESEGETKEVDTETPEDETDEESPDQEEGEEDTSEKPEDETEDETEEVEEIAPEEEPAEEEEEQTESVPEEEPAEQEEQAEPVPDEEPAEEEDQKDKIEEIVNGLVEEVQTIKQDGQVSQKEVVGLITNMMEMVNLLVQAKPPTRKRRKNAATREFEIAMRVAGRSYMPRYVLKTKEYMVFPGKYGMTDVAWKSTYGSPTSQSIRRYVSNYNLSLEPSGANAHLGREMAIWGAEIIDQTTGEMVSEWSDRSIIQQYKSKPMFEVV